MEVSVMFTGNTASIPLTTLAAGLDCKAERAFAPGRLAWLMARVRSRGLDRKLIAGADPGASPVLAARAGQLTQRSTRARLANQLDDLVNGLDARPGRLIIRPRGGAVRASQDELRQLAARLRGSAPVYADGMAMLADLITDGTGPVYAPGHGATLAGRLRTVSAAIGGPTAG
jgi:hypothetical protein